MPKSFKSNMKRSNIFLVLGVTLIIFGWMLSSQYQLAIVEPTELIYSHNFSDGTLGVLVWWGYSYQIVNNTYVILESTPTAGGSASVLRYQFDSLPQSTVKGSMHIAFETLPIDIDAGIGLMRVTYTPREGSHLAQLSIQKKATGFIWSIESPYSAKYMSTSPMIINLGQIYFVEYVLRLGTALDSEMLLRINGQEILTVTGMNLTGTPYLNTVDFGMYWATPSQKIDVYDVAVYGVSTVPITRTISGILKDSGTMSPLGGATISAGVMSDVTDPTGIFNITVSPGVYTLTATKSGYVSSSLSVDVTVGNSTNLQVLMSPITIPPEKGILSVKAYEGNTSLTITATVMNNNTVIGQGMTPFEMQLNAGTYTVSAEHNGQIKTQTASVTSGTTTNVILDFVTTSPPLISPPISLPSSFPLISTIMIVVGGIMVLYSLTLRILMRKKNKW